MGFFFICRRQTIKKKKKKLSGCSPRSKDKSCNPCSCLYKCDYSSSHKFSNCRRRRGKRYRRNSASKMHLRWNKTWSRLRTDSVQTRKHCPRNCSSRCRPNRAKSGTLGTILGKTRISENPLIKTFR